MPNPLITAVSRLNHDIVTTLSPQDLGFDAISEDLADLTSAAGEK
jgi:hypothetical protein